MKACATVAASIVDPRNHFQPFAALLQLVLMLCALVAAQRIAAQPPGMPRDETLSENGKFAAEIVESDDKGPVLSVLKVDGDSRTLLWKRSLAEQEETDDPGFFASGSSLFKLVSNDGSIVLLRQRFYAGMDDPMLRVLTRNGGDHEFAREDITAPVEHLMDDEVELTGSWPNAPLELLMDSENPPIYAVWERSSRKWLVIDLDKNLPSLASPTSAQRFNALGLAKARESVRQYHPGGLKKLLKPLRTKAAQVVPQLVSDDGSDSYEVPEGAYRFLAAQKDEKDKTAIEDLLRAELQPSSGFSMDMVELFLRSPARQLGDELLAAWEGKSNAKDGEPDPIPWRAKLHYLSRLSGTVKLPFTLPEKPGSIWIYLIPDDVPQGEWDKHKSVEAISHDFGAQFGFRGYEQDDIDSIRFTFDTLAPGRYRVKAVWDRRPPYATGQDTVAVAAAGDYESVESKVFALAAGKSVKGVTLECTNRVGAAKEFYSADEVWKAGNSSISAEPDEPEDIWRPSEEKVLVDEPVSSWVLKTNSNKAELQLKRIQLTEGIRFGNERPGKQLVVRFAAPRSKKGRRGLDSHFSGWLVDEHGCKFETYGSSSSGRDQWLTFPIVPYASKQIELHISKQDFESATGSSSEDVAASFVLTNLFKATPAKWTAEALPIKRELDIVTVELTSFNSSISEHPAMSGPGMPAEFFSQPPQRGQNQFSFTTDGKTAPGWYKLSAEFEDRWGNVSYQINGFCSADEVIKYSVRFARDARKGEFSADEKWELPIGKMPTAGEAIALRQTNQMQGVALQVFVLGGTGEFTYRRGELVSATNEIDEVSLPHNLLQPRQTPRPKIYVKPSSAQASYGFGFPGPPGTRGRSHRVTIASRIPHLVCRFPNADDDVLVALLEQDDSIAEPQDAMMNRRHYYPIQHRDRRAIKFLPLDFRGGEVDRKLTFICQRPREAEFLLNVPQDRKRRQSFEDNE